jgi:hypothetical protein
MPLTHKLIASTTIGANTSTVTFSSIPGTYNHLIIKLSIRTNRNLDGYADVSMLFNGSTSTIYKQGGFQAAQTMGGQANGSASSQAWWLMQSQPTSISGYQYYFANGEFFIPNYTTSNPKIGRWESYATSGNQANAGIHRVGSVCFDSSSAITSITLRDDNSATIQQYSTIQLYGLTNS